LNNCFSSPDNNNSNDNTEIDYEIIQINENNCTQAESNKMVPAFIQQKFLQIIASSNDEVNEQSKKINSSKRVLDLEIASGLQPRITSQFQKYNISQGQSKNMIEKDPGCMSTNLYNLVNDRNFWANVECLTYVSSPAKKAVKCIESANSTLADFFLILIQMAATIKQLPISDSTEHKELTSEQIEAQVVNATYHLTNSNEIEEDVPFASLSDDGDDELPQDSRTFVSEEELRHVLQLETYVIISNQVFVSNLVNIQDDDSNNNNNDDYVENYIGDTDYNVNILVDDILNNEID
ncbi:21703_t:CDS:2, partial [Entrophospora sp. SA101]